ncbi:MAG: DUF92 domain-containing protein [Candidatus Micrarchaeia archaeon]
MTFLTLDKFGIMGGIILAGILFALGREFGVLFVGALVVFLVLSALATETGKKRKRELKLYEKSRGIRNVIANGLGPLIMAIVFYVADSGGFYMLAVLSVVGFVGSVAAITSDKFASEIGVLGGEPRMLLTFNKVRRGTSGGVSALGLSASLAASILISLLLIPYAGSLNALAGFELAAGIAGVSIGGFLGNIADSILGYYEEKGIGNKFSTNFICSITGAVISMLLYFAL